MTKQYFPKKDAAARVRKNIGKYLTKVKPQYSPAFTPVSWKKLADFLFGLIAGQSCFLNTIAEHTPHYADRKKRGKLLGKPAQVEKLSGWLDLPVFARLLFSYLAQLRQELFPGEEHEPECERKQNRSGNITERVFRKRLMLHDGSDLQKPYAKAMEYLCRCRDGSKSTAQTAVTGKGYLIEGSVAFRQGRLFPCLLSLYSTTEKAHRTEKEETKKNLDTLRKNGLLEGFLHVFDRGYDAVAFMAWCLQAGVNFLIRANLDRSIVRREEYDRRMGATAAERIRRGKQTTQQQRNDMFYPLASLLERMTFHRHPAARYSWFVVAWETVYLKGEAFPKYADDILPVTFVSVRITAGNVKGIDEDLYPGGGMQGKGEGKGEGKSEREIHLFTTEAVRDIDDAVVLFLCYLLRWQIETFFRWIKQVFGLERVRIRSFRKIRNLLVLLPIAANYLYGKFREFRDKEEAGQTMLLQTVFQKEAPKRNDDTITAEILFFHCREYCRTKGLTKNADSFARSIHELMRHDEAYRRITINYDCLDSG